MDRSKQTVMITISITLSPAVLLPDALCPPLSRLNGIITGERVGFQFVRSIHVMVPIVVRPR
jgi:hypothetical protein